MEDWASTCGRCKEKGDPDAMETCWYCIGPMCSSCWDDHGHCGHPEADAINEQGRQVPQPGEVP